MIRPRPSTAGPVVDGQLDCPPLRMPEGPVRVLQEQPTAGLRRGRAAARVLAARVVQSLDWRVMPVMAHHRRMAGRALDRRGKKPQAAVGLERENLAGFVMGVPSGPLLVVLGSLCPLGVDVHPIAAK